MLLFFRRPAMVMAVKRATNAPAAAAARAASKMSGQMSRPIPSQLSSTIPKSSLENDPTKGSAAPPLPDAPYNEASYL